MKDVVTYDILLSLPPLIHSDTKIMVFTVELDKQLIYLTYYTVKFNQSWFMRTIWGVHKNHVHFCDSLSSALNLINMTNYLKGLVSIQLVGFNYRSHAAD